MRNRKAACATAVILLAAICFGCESETPRPEPKAKGPTQELPEPAAARPIAAEPTQPEPALPSASKEKHAVAESTPRLAATAGSSSSAAAQPAPPSAEEEKKSVAVRGLPNRRRHCWTSQQWHTVADKNVAAEATKVVPARHAKEERAPLPPAPPDKNSPRFGRVGALLAYGRVGPKAVGDSQRGVRRGSVSSADRHPEGRNGRQGRKDLSRQGRRHAARRRTARSGGHATTPSFPLWPAADDRLLLERRRTLRHRGIAGRGQRTLRPPFVGKGLQVVGVSCRDSATAPRETPLPSRSSCPFSSTPTARCWRRSPAIACRGPIYWTPPAKSFGLTWNTRAAREMT